MRSIFGRARVTQTVRPCASRGGQFFGRHQRQLCGLPALKAAFQRFGRNIEMPQPGRGALRELLAAQADDDGRAAGKFLAPVGGFLVAAPDGAGNQPLVGGEILVGPNVDQGRRVRRADQAESLSGEIVV